MREVGGWIVDDNLAKVVEYVAALVHYRWDDLDDGALEAGIQSTDSDRPPDTWFEYLVVGTPVLTLRIARNPGAGTLSMIIRGEFDAVLEARLDTVLDLH